MLHFISDFLNLDIDRSKRFMHQQSELIQLSKGDPVDHFLMIRKFETRTTKAGKNLRIIKK